LDLLLSSLSSRLSTSGGGENSRRKLAIAPFIRFFRGKVNLFFGLGGCGDSRKGVGVGISSCVPFDLALAFPVVLSRDTPALVVALLIDRSSSSSLVYVSALFVVSRINRGSPGSSLYVPASVIDLLAGSSLSLFLTLPSVNVDCWTERSSSSGRSVYVTFLFSFSAVDGLTSCISDDSFFLWRV
jgi:hypothetical protein